MVNLKCFVTVISEISLFLIFSFVPTTIKGCGQLPFGQERILRFNVSGFSLALPLAHTEHSASRALYPSVQENAMQVETFVRNLIMRAVNDVLEQQGRSAGLSYDVISAILSQLIINATYESLKCDTVSILDPAYNNHRLDMKENCIVVGDKVDVICTKNAMADCMGNAIKAIPQQHLRFTGTLRVTNIILAGWSDQMWRTILSRVRGLLSSGPLGANFQTASIDIV